MRVRERELTLYICVYIRCVYFMYSYLKKQEDIILFLPDSRSSIYFVAVCKATDSVSSSFICFAGYLLPMVFYLLVCIRDLGKLNLALVV